MRDTEFHGNTHGDSQPAYPVFLRWIILYGVHARLGVTVEGFIHEDKCAKYYKCTKTTPFFTCGTRDNCGKCRLQYSMPFADPPRPGNQLKLSSHNAPLRLHCFTLQTRPLSVTLRALCPTPPLGGPSSGEPFRRCYQSSSALKSHFKNRTLN